MKLKPLALALLLAASAACSSLGSASAGASPVPALVQASRAVHDELGVALRASIAADPAFSQLARDQALKLVDDWRLAIEAAERYLGGAVAPLPLDEAAAADGVVR